ncbi:MAG: esterase/lipase family protein [Actinomycetota bacterium]
MAPAVAAPMAETAILRAVAPGSVGLAPQITAPPPLDLFHDLRWISVFHNSWVALALELLGVIALRSVWMAWVVHHAWPEGEPAPAMRPAARRASFFYALSTLLFVPWVVLLFGLAFSHLSFLFFAAIPPALAIAAIVHRGAASRAAGARLGWRPTWRSLAWILGSFVWLTISGAVVTTASAPVALAAAAAAGLLNARAAYGVVQDIALRHTRRPLPALVPALVTTVFVVTVGGSALGFALTAGHQHAGHRHAGVLPAAAPGEHPVLIAAGLHSRYDPRSPLRLPRGYVAWRFSYRGLGSRGRPLSYGPAATQQSLLVSAHRMARQVEALHRAYGEPVTVVAESEGALVARTYLLDLYPPATHAVDRLITLDMPSGSSAVYFPPRGRQGWGVGSGWGLRGLARLLGAIAPLRLSVDSSLGREFIDCRALLARLAVTPQPAGVQEVSFQALADMVDPPAEAPPGIQTYLVGAPHGGMMERRSVQDLIQGILSGGSSAQNDRGPGFVARLVAATARPWESPSLPLALDPSGSCVGG